MAILIYAKPGLLRCFGRQCKSKCKSPGANTLGHLSCTRVWGLWVWVRSAGSPAQGHDVGPLGCDQALDRAQPQGGGFQFPADGLQGRVRLHAA
jgi:hypothetical protein